MILIDSHAHIYLKEFDDDRDQMMGRAREAGVQEILMPA
ncbi:MAG TPA: TatD family hydrolase, partial [Chitinophagaceae bacterium]|nr:TatD family hydrolase [Chitinophagaceae bacterium]